MKTVYWGLGPNRYSKTHTVLTTDATKCNQEIPSSYYAYEGPFVEEGIPDCVYCIYYLANLPAEELLNFVLQVKPSEQYLSKLQRIREKNS